MDINEEQKAMAQGGGTWKGWKQGEFQAHFIFTGVGESIFLIFPDGTSMLLDCGDQASVMRHQYAVPVLPDPYSMAGEWIARYVKRVNPNGNKVDYMFTSHLHSDHTGTPNWQSAGTIVKTSDAYYRSGFGIAAEELVFGTAIDRGWPDYNDPITYVDDFDRCMEHLKMLYSYLQDRDGLKVEKFRVGAVDQVVPRHGGCDGFQVKNICGNGYLAQPDGTLLDMFADQKAAGVKRINENAMSLGLVFSYGPFRLSCLGDFSHGCHYVKDGCVDRGGIEDLLADVCGPMDVVKLTHHGHHSMPPKLVSALKARAYVACIWDQLHITSDTMTTLADRSLYPGERTFFPGIFTKERRAEDAGKAWTKDIPTCVYEGAHIVVSVPAGGETYSVTCLDARNEDMKVLGVFNYQTSAK